MARLGVSSACRFQFMETVRSKLGCCATSRNWPKSPTRSCNNDGRSLRSHEREQRSGAPQFPRGGAMKLDYYPETDSLYIELKSTPGTEAREIVAGLVVDLDANGEVVGFDIDHASRKLDLSKVETIALPPASAAE